MTMKLKRGTVDAVSSYVSNDSNQPSNDLTIAIEQTIGFYNDCKKQSLDYRNHLSNDDSVVLNAIYGLGNGYTGGVI